VHDALQLQQPGLADHERLFAFERAARGLLQARSGCKRRSDTKGVVMAVVAGLVALRVGRGATEQRAQLGDEQLAVPPDRDPPALRRRRR